MFPYSSYSLDTSSPSGIVIISQPSKRQPISSPAISTPPSPAEESVLLPGLPADAVLTAGRARPGTAVSQDTIGEDASRGSRAGVEDIESGLSYDIIILIRNASTDADPKNQI